jgi:chromosome segregation ATPase
MKLRGQTMVGDGFDGFDRNVAEKMPKIKKEEDFSPSLTEEETPPLPSLSAAPQELKPLERPTEKKAIFTPQPKGEPRKEEEEENGVVLNLIDDLHAQLLVSNRTRRAMEIDLASSQKTIQHLDRENKTLRIQAESLKKELQGFKEIQSELTYIEEENEDALERITLLQGEIKTLKENLAGTAQERDQALSQIQTLEARIDQNDFLRIKGRLKEREVSHFSEENSELRARLEEALTQNIDLEKKYEALKRSFNEVKESLTLLRDTCKTSYYNLSEPPEEDLHRP